MSVLIKGMDKETAVRLCAYAGVRMDDSDFVSVPPHGRLIDTSYMVETQLYDDEHEEWTDVKMTVEEYLGYCCTEVPTIIPAEEGE